MLDNKTKWDYNFRIWPRFEHVTKEFAEILQMSICMVEYTFTEKEFTDFLLQLKSAEFEIHEVSRKLHTEWEVVSSITITPISGSSH